MNLNLDKGQLDDARLTAAMAGQYRFSLNSIFDEAWAKTKGFKSTYWAALGVIVLLTLGLFLLSTLIVGMVGIYTGGIVGEQLHLVTPFEKAIEIPTPMFGTLIALTLVGLFVILPLIAGLWMLSISYVSGQQVHFKMIFSYYRKPVRYWLANIWTTLLIQLGSGVGGPLAKVLEVYGGVGVFWLCVIVGFVIQIYALVSYFFVLPLLADRKLTTWKALESGRKVIGQHWFKVFFAILVIFCVCALIPGFVIGLLVGTIHITMLAFLVLFIWLLPFYSLSTAILYREIFGVASVENLPRTTL